MNTFRHRSPAVLGLATILALSPGPGLGAAEPAPAAAIEPAPVLAPTAPAQPVERTKVDPAVIAADVLVVRPVGLAATAIGAAIFVVALPFAAITRDVKGVGASLVGQPANFTFKRALGDFDSP